MSRTQEQVQLEAEEIRRKRLEAVGLADQYDAWRESLPNARIPDNETYEMFMNSQIAEEAATSGKLSVSTGGTEVTFDTDIPAPGPDGEETGPDGAGDTSKGGDGAGDGEKLEPEPIKGLWQLPEESEALNYEPPSTYKMSHSKDWIENAKIIHKFMKPNGEQPSHGGPVGMGSMAEITGKSKELSDEQMGQWARNQLSGFNWNVMNTLNYAQKIMTSEDPKVALAFLNLINMYDHSDGSAMEFAGAIGEIATDPTTYIGLGAGSVVAKGAAKTMAKSGLKKAIQMAIIGGTAGATEGGMLAGGFDLTVQNIEQEAGTKDDIDYGRAATATGMGIGLGTALGGVGGRWAGRKMDKFAAEVERQRLIAAGADNVLDLRSAQELGETNALEFLSEVSKNDPLLDKLAIRILDEDGQLPRLEDGSMDLEKILKAMDEVKAEAIAKAKQKRLNEIYPPGPDEQIGGRNTPEKKAMAHIGQFLNAEDIFVRTVTEDSIVFDMDMGVGYDTDVNPIIRDVARKMGLEIQEGINKTAEGSTRTIEVKGTVAQLQEFAKKLGNEVNPEFKLPPIPDNIIPFVPEIADVESQKFVQMILELQELERGDVVMRSAGRPGSTVRDGLGETYEVVGRTKNGWYHLRDKRIGEEKSLRRKDFEVVDKAPAPQKAGPMELDPFSETAAKIIHMNEQVVSGKLKEVKTTHAEQRAMAKELQDLGVDITDKKISAHWSPSELVFLRDTYNAQALGMADLARRLDSDLRNNGMLAFEDLAMFNQAHAQFVATRDLFYGVSGNAARQLNILRSRPTDEVYQFGQSLMDSISMQGGRNNTERAIKLMADFARKSGDDKSNAAKGISRMSDNIWGNAKASAILNVRYNMMLSSWRTHFFNFLGNSASGVYQHLMISPVRMGINNMAYARDLARSTIQPSFKPDPADRLTRFQWYAELRGHYAGFFDSLSLAKEIAMGRDIGEGKVWNELGLRYNVINVPDTAFGKMGTTPVRLLEAGDAFFKNQYYNSKMHEIASIKARSDQVHLGMEYKTQYNKYLDNPIPSEERVAKEFAAKQTYTNDPNVYGGVLAALAKGASSAQNKSLMINMIIPFVRTPANLLSYSMEMIGANTILSPSKTYDTIMKGTALESQEAMARLTVAAGLWLTVAEMYQNGDITGTGPSNWEERKAWEAAGWQSNSIRIHGNWIDMSRAAPAGQSLSTIASVFDYYAMTQQQDKPFGEWIGAGLLYTSDMIMDESYLSTVSDVITAISSKETGRARATAASMINSILVPNLIRDLRRPTDETMRSTTSNNLMSQVHKQMINASPWLSENLPPSRDWKGEAVNYYGNAYVRGLIPFNMRDSENSDPASMAIAYSRIAPSIPNRTIDWPGGQGDGIDLFVMDNGGGYVYDKYLQMVGDVRKRAVDEAMRSSAWKDAVAINDIGPNSTGDQILRKAMNIGSQLGRLSMLEFLIEHHGGNNTFNRGNGDIIHIQHPVSVDTYLQLHSLIREQGLEKPEDAEQYIIKKPVEGPEFFKP